MKTEQSEDVLRFWFPIRPNADQATLVRQWQLWFRGGMDTGIIEHFSPLLLLQAIQGEFDDWFNQPRSRLALILVLDQFSRTLYQGTAQAYAQDPKVCALSEP